jgi:uncharacterized membrane protein YadS
MLGGKFKTVRSAIKFFLVTFSTAYLFTIGVKLTGWFTRSPDIPAEGMQGVGLSIIFGVAILIAGATLRRFTAAESQAALLGAAAVLLTTPTVQFVTTHNFDFSSLVVTGLGVITLVLGLLVALSRGHSGEEQD